MESNELSGYDRSRALEMQARGASLEEIALTLDLSVSQLDPVIRKSNRANIPKSPEERESEAGKHIAILQHVVREMLLAWERSKNDLVITKVTTYDGSRDSGEELIIRRKVEMTTTPNIGNASFIKELRGTLDDIRAIVALNAPKQMIIDSQEAHGPRMISIIEVVEPEK